MTDPRWSDQVGAYVLDALDTDERSAFEARLEHDGELRRLVEEARASTLVLAEALPDMVPPAHLRDRVMERMRAAKASGALGDEAEERPRGERPDIHPGRSGRVSPGKPPSRVRATAPWLLLAASVAGLFWLGSENRNLMERSVSLEDELAAVRTSLGEAQVAVARLDSMAAAISGPNVQVATLSGDADPTLRLVWNRDRNLLLVAAQNLPPLAQGRTYQLWGIRGTEAPVSLGTFDTGADGDALVTLPASAVGAYEVSAITDEPAGGSPQPTTQPFLVGAWNTAQ